VAELPKELSFSETNQSPREEPVPGWLRFALRARLASGICPTSSKFSPPRNSTRLFSQAPWTPPPPVISTEASERERSGETLLPANGQRPMTNGQ